MTGLPPGKLPADLVKVGVCAVCHIPLYTWGDPTPRDLCGAPDCTHPDELCNDLACLARRRARGLLPKGGRKTARRPPGGRAPSSKNRKQRKPES